MTIQGLNLLEDCIKYKQVSRCITQKLLSTSDEQCRDSMSLVNSLADVEGNGCPEWAPRKAKSENYAVMLQSVRSRKGYLSLPACIWDSPFPCLVVEAKISLLPILAKFYITCCSGHVASPSTLRSCSINH